MELALNCLSNRNQIDGQDIRWLKYIWECSDGKEVYLYESKIPEGLRHTVIYPHLFQRLLFYKDSQNLFYDFEFHDASQCYYIVLENGFVNSLNLIIDDINYKNYNLENPIPYIKEKGQIFININNEKINGPVINQIGDQNSVTQSCQTQKESGIKINFTAMLKTFLKMIPFLKNFIE